MKTLGFNSFKFWQRGALSVLFLAGSGMAAVDTEFHPGVAESSASSNQVSHPAKQAKRDLASNAMADAVEANIKRVQLEDERPVPECERYGRNPILCCLAQEEQALNDAHLASGPLYKLNTTLIDEMRNIDGIWPTAEAERQICHNPDFSPSVALVKELLLKGKGVFINDPHRDDLDVASGGLQNAAAEALVEHTPRIFFDYISYLQMMVSLPECLNYKIPALKEFQDKVKDLESEKTAGKIVIPAQIEKIFEGLKKFERYARECAAEQQKRLQQQKQARLRLMRQKTL